MSRLSKVTGRACVLRGDDIDTDRIIPARFLRCVTFRRARAKHAFEDDRIQAKGDHPLDDGRFDGASVLIVGANFGCGSSREHAPQALMRWGFQAFIGLSFGEIFAGNCTALGLPYATLAERDLAALMDSVSLDPEQPIEIDIEARTVTSRAGTVPATIPDGVRKQLIEDTWNATQVLLEAGDAIRGRPRRESRTSRISLGDSDALARAKGRASPVREAGVPFFEKCVHPPRCAVHSRRPTQTPPARLRGPHERRRPGSAA